jgi:hypothetical protein
MSDLQPRVRAVLDLSIPTARELAGRHEYDGVLQDLSPQGVATGVGRLGGEPVPDPHDEAQLDAFEERARLELGTLQLHRRNPLPHLDNLDLACYDRPYAPEPERAAARRRHLQGWPDAIDASLESLDAVPAPVAASLLDAAQGLAAGLDADRSDDESRALAAHRRLLDRLRASSTDGPPEFALGGTSLALLLGVPEATTVDLAVLAGQAEAELGRLTGLLAEAVERISPGRPVDAVVAELLADHPDTDGVVREARALTEEVLAFTRSSGLAPVDDGVCVVDIAPESRRWGVAMLGWAAPGEPEGPSFYHVTPPEPEWPADEQEEWLSMFNRTTLPAITVHEVAPGHFTHGRAMRRVDGDVRRNLMSDAFGEGWAHYVEEVCLEEGFRDGDPRFAAGVALEALIRVVRLVCSIGMHTGAMTVEEATARFQRDALLGLAGARSEARRGTFDPRYGQYTWGKLELRRLDALARDTWGATYSRRRFHDALLALGSPPLGLLDEALRRG